MMIPNIWKGKKKVPNHPPDNYHDWAKKNRAIPRLLLRAPQLLQLTEGISAELQAPGLIGKKVLKDVAWDSRSIGKRWFR